MLPLHTEELVRVRQAERLAEAGQPTAPTRRRASVRRSFRRLRRPAGTALNT
jgi:hypothetical protein